MRKLSTANITNSNGMPIKGGTLLHLQLAYEEALTALAKNMVARDNDTTRGYILFGLVNSGTSSSMNVSAGAIYYNGEVFLVDAFTLTVAGGQAAVASITTTQYATDADPVTFTDGVARNVHNIRKITFASAASGSGIFDFDNMLTTPLILRNVQENSLGSTYTVKFDQDKTVFFATAAVDTTITFDFTNAVVGNVVRLKWTYGAGRALTIDTPAGSTILKDSGNLANVSGNTNVLYAIYLGRNAAGNHEVSYNLKQPL